MMSGRNIRNELQQADMDVRLTGNINDNDSDIVRKANSILHVLNEHRRNTTVGDPTMLINDIWNSCQVRPDSRKELLEIIKALEDLELIRPRITNEGYPKKHGMLDV